jgi:hypothetical protein
MAERHGLGRRDSLVRRAVCLAMKLWEEPKSRRAMREVDPQGVDEPDARHGVERIAGAVLDGGLPRLGCFHGPVAVGLIDLHAL